MPKIRTQTLVIAIEAVGFEINRPHAVMDDGGAVPGDYELLEQYERAAEDLKDAYDEEARTVTNLPEYDRLTGGRK